ncbi:MAG TPA: hypothetical protein VN799_00025 [Acidimicrobiales bacterium]|nr:hypothetical protein [Acidimicrobiales bacterium]
MSAAPTCAACARGVDALHHITGRPYPDGPYLDRDLGLGLCLADHVRVHVVLRAAGIEWEREGDVRVRHRLRRAAVHLRWLVDLHRPLSLSVGSTAALAALLLDAVDVLSELS